MLVAATAKELPVEQSIFNEAWSMVKDYHYIEEWGNEQEWEKVVERGDKLYNQGKGNPELYALSKGIALAVLEYLAFVSKGKGDKEACLAARHRQLENEEAIRNQFKGI